MKNTRGASTIIWIIIGLVLAGAFLVMVNGGLSKTWTGITGFFKSNNVASVQTICIDQCKSGDHYTYCEEEIELRLKRGKSFSATCNTFSRIAGNDKNELGGLIAICPQAYCFEETSLSEDQKKEEGKVCVLDAQCISEWCYNNLCRKLEDKLKNGDSCILSKHCSSGFCDPKDSICKKKPEGSSVPEDYLTLNSIPIYLRDSELKSSYENSVAGEETTLILERFDAGKIGWAEFFVTIQEGGLDGEEKALQDKTIVLPSDFSEVSDISAEVKYTLPQEVGKWIVFNFYVKSTNGKWYKFRNSLVTLLGVSRDTLQDENQIASIMKKISSGEIKLETISYDEKASSWKEMEKTCICDSKDDTSEKSCKNYAEAIVLSAHTYQLNEPLLLLAMMIQESNCNADAVGPSGEIGLMQINSPLHISSYEAQHGALTPKGNIMIGAQILKEKYDEYNKGILESSTYNSKEVFKSFIDNCLKAGYTRYKYYKEWNAALRGYNGWGCNTGNSHYVEEVNYLYGKLHSLYVQEFSS